MKTSILFLSLFVLSATQAAWAESATLVINSKLDVTERNLSGYGSCTDLDHADCSLCINSQDPVVLKPKTVLNGEVSVQEKSVWKDADSVDKSGTTQFTFKTEDGKLEISAACFSHGFLFPTVGLPTLRELEELTERYLTLRK